MHFFDLDIRIFSTTLKVTTSKEIHLNSFIGDSFQPRGSAFSRPKSAVKTSLSQPEVSQARPCGCDNVLSPRQGSVSRRDSYPHPVWSVATDTLSRDGVRRLNPPRPGLAPSRPGPARPPRGRRSADRSSVPRGRREAGESPFSRARASFYGKSAVSTDGVSPGAGEAGRKPVFPVSALVSR